MVDLFVGSSLFKFRRRPANKSEKSMTKLPIKFAIAPSLNTIPMVSEIAAAARLKRTIINMNLKKIPQFVCKPVMGYKMIPMIIGGMSRNGMISNITFEAKYVIGL